MYHPPLFQKNDQTPLVLIAGGAGFIGSHLTEHLLSQPLRILVIDSLERGRKDCFSSFVGHPRFSFIQHDLNSGIPKEIVSANYIIDLAGEELPAIGEENQGLNSLLTNALGTHNLLEAARNWQAKVLLTSSIYVYRGAISSSKLGDYFGQETAEEREFSFDEAKRFAETLAFEYFKKYNLDIRLARLGEVYGPRMNLKTTGNLGRFIENVLNNDNLVIHGDGLEKEYYCHISDTVEGLVKTLFKRETKGNIYPLTSPNPVTTLELAYLVKNLTSAGTQIVFKPSVNDFEMPEVKTIDVKLQKSILWKPKIFLKDGVRSTLEHFGYKVSASFGEKKLTKAPPVANENNFPNDRVQGARKPLFRFSLPKFRLTLRPKLRPFGLARRLKNQGLPLLSIFILSSFLLVFLPLLVTTFYIGSTFLEIASLRREVRTLNLSRAIKRIEKVSHNVSALGKIVSNFPFFSNRSTNKLLNSGKLLSGGVDLALRATQPYLEILPRLTSQEDVPARKPPEAGVFDQSTENYSAALDQIELAEADYKEVDKRDLPFFFQTSIVSYEKLLRELNADLRMLINVSKLAADSLGIDGPRRYLLTFTNPNELRPTGGFIGSLGKIEISQGKISKTEIFDVYDVDGQIDEKGIRVAEPLFLSSNLHTDYLHLRDANYSPFFPDNAERIRKLYKLVADESTDAVVSIDLMALEELLKVTGPITLPSYDEVVNAENVFEKVQNHAESSYFPGSSQKRTFLSLLSQQLIMSLYSLEPPQLIKLGQIVRSLLNEKHVLVDFPEKQTIVADLNWDGRLLDTEGDYLMVVDANVGANKANFFVTRSITYQIERSNREGEYLVELTVDYQHRGKSNAWPGGTYKNHLRIYAPAKASLLNVEMSKKGRAGDGENVTNKVEASHENGRSVFATTFSLESGTETRLTYTYVLPESVVPQTKNDYTLLVQKQPGTRADPFRLIFRTPFGKTLGEVPPNFKTLGTQVEWNGNLAEDRYLEIPLK